MKSAARPSAGYGLPRHLVAMFAYVNRRDNGGKSVDGSFGGAEIHLDRLAAAARMQ